MAHRERSRERGCAQRESRDQGFRESDRRYEELNVVDNSTEDYTITSTRLYSKPARYRRYLMKLQWHSLQVTDMGGNRES